MGEYDLLMFGAKKALGEFVENFKHPEADISYTIRKMPPDPRGEGPIEHMLRMYIEIDEGHIPELRGKYMKAWVTAQSVYPALKEIGSVSLRALTATEMENLERERRASLAMPQSLITT